MTRVSRAAFRRLLDGLDDAELAAFVAAVYDARGWETEHDDGIVVTPPGAGRPRRLAVPGDGDHVATPVGDTATAVDAADLREMVLYAVDADDRERLFRRFFDRDPADIDAATDDDGAPNRRPGTETATDADGAPNRRPGTETATDADGAPTRTRDASDATGVTRHETPTAISDASGSATTREPESETGSDDEPSRTIRWLTVGLTVALVGGVVAAAGPALPSTTPTGEGGAAANGTAMPDAGDEELGATAEGKEGERLPVASGVRRVETTDDLPPGVADGGVVDASTLADAHEDALTDRSYRLRIVHREFADGELRGVAHERATIAASDRYRSRVRQLGALRHESTVIGDGSAYANGETRYVRPLGGRDTPESARTQSRVATATTEPDRFADRTGRYVRWYLSVERSWLVGTTERNGTTLVRIAFAGDPWPGATNVTGRALIDEHGLVRVLRRTYVPANDPRVRVETTIRITPGQVTVTRPEWVESSRSPTPTASSLNDSDARRPTAPRLDGRAPGAKRGEAA
ncbi:MAG: hypothetical protein ABEJ73_06160 [Haloplanus sp.]